MHSTCNSVAPGRREGGDRVVKLTSEDGWEKEFICTRREGLHGFMKVGGAGGGGYWIVNLRVGVELSVMLYHLW